MSPISLRIILKKSPLALMIKKYGKCFQQVSGSYKKNFAFGENSEQRVIDVKLK